MKPRLSGLLILIASLCSTPLFAGYAASPTSTTSGTDSGGATSSTLRLEVTSVSNSSNNVTFRITKKDGSSFTTSGTLSIRLDCGGPSCSVVTSSSVSAGTTSKSFTVYMPTYVQGTVVKNFYARYAASTGYWSYAGSIAISAPSLTTPGSTSTTEIGTTSARLNWGSVTAAESYRYQVTSSTSFATSGDGSVCSNCIANATTTGTTQVVTGLTSATTYRWRVRAGNATTGQGSLWSSTVTFTTMAPAVTSVTPTSATLGQLTTFTVSGTNLTAGMGFWIADCAGVTEVSGGSASSRQFRCTPSFSTGSKDGEVKTAPGGTLLRAFTVNVTAPLPSVSSVTPMSAILGQATTFTVAGTNLTAGMGFWIADCSGVTEISGGSASSRQFRCTPSFSAGSKDGEVKTAPGGTLLRAFTVNVTAPLPTVTSVAPLTAVLGQVTTFTVAGTNLTAGMGFWIHDCAGVTEIAGGTAESRQFRCTPGTSTGTKAGEVKTAPSGTLLHTFSVNVILLPTVTEVKPINAILGEPTVFTVYGSSLPAGMGFWVHDCTGISELSGGTATERLFRCTPSFTTGAKPGEVKTAAGGTLLRSFTVNAIVRPTGISVAPLQATLNVPLTFTIDGTGLPAGMGFWVDDCAGVTELAGGTSSRRQFRCTPGDNGGVKSGEVKAASAGTLLLAFSVNVAGLPPTVSSVTPLTAILGQETTFTVAGTNLTAGMGFWIHDCAGVAEIPGGSAASRQFRCTPSFSTGTKNGEVKTAPDGTLLRQFSVAVAGSGIYVNVDPWAQAAADFMVQHGIVVDPPGHDLRGTSDIRRAELAAMLYRALGGGLAEADARFAAWHGGLLRSPFVDAADPTVWYYQPAAYLGNLTFGDGISVFDRAQGAFRPDGTISRAWAVKAILETWDIPPLTSLQGVTLFTDVPASHPAAGYVYQAVEKGIATGTAGVFAPDAAADRQDLFVLLHRLLDATANARSLAVPSPAPLAPADFDNARAFAPRTLGSRYEQPVLVGVQAPAASITVIRSGLETVGTLQGLYTVTLEAVVSGIDARSFTDAGGIVYRASPFCAWEAASGGLVDETPAGGIPFSRVKWVAPSDSSPAGGGSLDVLVTLRVGDGLGSEVTAVRSLTMSGRPASDSSLPLVTIDALPVVQAGEIVEVTGSIRDSGDSESASFGNIEMSLSFSRNGGVSWTPIGRAALRSDGHWDTLWRVQEPAGSVVLRARAVNVRGNQREAQVGTTITPRLSIQGVVVSTSSQPLPGARVTLSEGGIDLASVLADAQGAFLFTRGGSQGLVTGRSYTLTAVMGAQRATASGIVLTSTAPQAERTLTIGIDSTPPVTEASVPSGVYSAPFSVTLTCQDDSSGCAAIYYTTNGSTPTTASSAYTAPIPVSAGLTLRFFAVDARGNREEPRRRTYTFQACSFEVTPVSATFPRSGGAGEVTVHTGSDCIWRLESATPWITVTAGGDVRGPGSAGYAVAPNTGEAPRSGSLTVAGRTVAITQAGAVSHTLTVVKDGNGSGTVFSSPAGLSCGGTCSASFPEGVQVVLAATPASGSTFAGWSGDPDCTDGIVTMSAARSCTATFILEQAQTFSLTVQLAGSGSGRVTSIPAGIDCGLDCSETLPANTQVVLQAVPDPGSGLALWSGDPDCADGVVTLLADRTCVATFELQTSCTSVWTSGGPEGGLMRLVWIDPDDLDHLYAGGAGGLFESHDGGEGWSSTGLGPRPVTAFAVDLSVPRTLYAASLSSVFKSTDGGETWSESRPVPGSGTVLTLAIDPATPSTLWAGFNWPGLAKSTDAGATWSPVEIGVTGVSINAVVIDPANPRNIYLATGGSGVFRSTDGGTTWSPRDGGLSSLWVRTLALARGTSSTLLASTLAGVHRSTDAGATWTTELTMGEMALAQAPGEPSTFYAGDKDGNIWKSLDNGDGWNWTGTPSNTGGILGLTVSPTSASLLYIATPGRGLLKSTDRGNTSREINKGLNSFSTFAITVVAEQPAVAFAGSTVSGLFKTTDGGITWTASGRGIIPLSVLDTAVASISALYVATGNWIFKSTNGGGSWTTPTGTLAGGPVQVLAVSSADPDVVYGLAGGSVFKSTDGARTWGNVGTGLGNVTRIEIHPDDPSKVLAQVIASGIGKLFKSDNGGSSWSLIGSGLPTSSVTDFAFDPSLPETVYAAAGSGFYRSTDGGAGWLLLGFVPEQAYSIAVNPSDSALLYAGTGNGVYRSVDGGMSWSRWSEGLSARIINDLVAVGVSPVVIYAATNERGVFEIAECPEVPLAVARLGTGSGTVTSLPVGIVCDPDCVETYPPGTRVTLTATADTGSTFTGWNGGGCSGAQSCIVVTDGPKTITATFTRQTFPLSVTVTGSGRVTSQPAGIDCGTDCTESYPSGSSVILTALPSVGSVFAGWSGASDCADGQITVNGPVSCTATFAPEAPVGGSFYTLTPCRILDTRDASEPFVASIPRLIQIAGTCGVPESAVAIAANVTVVQPTAEGWVTLWPAGLGYPGTLTNAFKAGDVRANNAVLPLGTGRLVGQPFLSAGGAVHLIIDVSGYFD